MLTNETRNNNQLVFCLQLASGIIFETVAALLQPQNLTKPHDLAEPGLYKRAPHL